MLPVNYNYYKKKSEKSFMILQYEVSLQWMVLYLNIIMRIFFLFFGLFLHLILIVSACTLLYIHQYKFYMKNY